MPSESCNSQPRNKVESYLGRVIEIAPVVTSRRFQQFLRIRLASITMESALVAIARSEKESLIAVNVMVQNVKVVTEMAASRLNAGNVVAQVGKNIKKQAHKEKTLKEQ